MARTIHCLEYVWKSVWVNREDGEKMFSMDHVIPSKEADGMNMIRQVNGAVAQWRSDKEG